MLKSIRVEIKQTKENLDKSIQYLHEEMKETNKDADQSYGRFKFFKENMEGLVMENIKLKEEVKVFEGSTGFSRTI